MARRKKGNPVHGWVSLDKPQDMTSTQAVSVVRRLFNARKAGHAGTLDPLATGILPIALGEATKTVPFAVDGTKVYRFTVRWGIETNTDDAQGEALKFSGERPHRAAIEAVLAEFIGEVMQVPPAFSSLRIAGERAYDLARSGEEVMLAPRPVCISRLELIETPDPDTSVFLAQCGRGTYVRALARDMGRLLGCFGHVVALRRVQVSAFLEEEAVTLDELRAAADASDGSLDRYLLPIETPLNGLLAINLNSSDASRLSRGQSVILRGRDAPIHAGEAFALSKGTLVALCEIARGELRPTRVFNYD